MAIKKGIGRISLLMAALPVLAGCGVKERTKAMWHQAVPAVLEKVPFISRESKPTGVTYPPLRGIRAKVIFEPELAQAGCNVFAHLLICTPPGANGHGLAGVVEKEALRWGADMILIGGSRKAKEDRGMDFVYYGPEEPYSCRDRWMGWKFGYADWISQGDWGSVGYNEWGRNEVWFSEPLVIQAAFLRCQG
ncbi:hypothetical protein VU07_02410 [Desulfobulbus sp. F4]|nr:hypothetical protein [Desulfobulbus sp. F4]